MKMGVCAFLIFCCFSFFPHQQIVGFWVSMDDDEEFIRFSEDHYATFYFDGDTLGGKRFYNEDYEEFHKLTFAIEGEGDTSKIDFILSKAENNEEVLRAKGWIFLKGDTMALMIDEFGGERPAQYDDIDVFPFVRKTP